MKMNENEQNMAVAAILKKVKQIEVKTNKLLTDSFFGAYKSVFKGQGIDFDEIREYAPGDDPRFIDWNVSAKLDKPFTKKFREERELNVMIVVDLSGSQSFGSGNCSKREFACEIATLLAFSAVKSGDKVGLTLFTDKIEKFVDPKKGKQNALRIIRDILFCENTSKGTDLTSALTFINKVLKHKTLIFFISDFIDNTSKDRLFNILKITNKHHDLVCLHILDKNEIKLPSIGLLTLTDNETCETIEVDTTDFNTLTNIQNLSVENINQTKKMFKRSGIDSLFLANGSDYMCEIRKFLLSRISHRIVK